MTYLISQLIENVNTSQLSVAYFFPSNHLIEPRRSFHDFEEGFYMPMMIRDRDAIDNLRRDAVPAINGYLVGTNAHRPPSRPKRGPRLRLISRRTIVFRLISIQPRLRKFCLGIGIRKRERVHLNDDERSGHNGCKLITNNAIN